MSPPISFSKAKTTYPIFAATFAHNHPGCLVVGGGGGAGRSGVGNKITAFDVSSRAPEIEPFAEIELSRDEDSVTCLANLATKDGLILYAGVNSSEQDRLADRNQHFRSFNLQYPKNREETKTELSPLNKTTLFKRLSTPVAKKEGYQRLLRLSRPKRTQTGSKRIGAVASSLAGDENEIVVFNATSSSPRIPEDVIHRIPLSKGEEANDIDIFEPEDGQFKVIYSTDHSIFVGDINYDFDKKQAFRDIQFSSKYTVPYPDVSEKKARFKIRCIRWISPSHILLLANLPNRSGVELQIMRLYGHSAGSITIRKKLPGHVKQAVDMDICTLDADETGAYQVVIAVAGIDVSTSIYTMDYRGTSANSLSRFQAYTTVRDVHPVQMTKLIFAPFFPPKNPSPQYLRLASTSLGNTIVVDNFTLKRVSSNAGARHVLSSGGALQQNLGYIIATVVAMIAVLLAWSMLAPAGNVTKALTSRNVGDAAVAVKAPSAVMQDIGASDASTMPKAVQSPVARTSKRLRDLLHIHHDPAAQATNTKALVVHHDPDSDTSLSTEVHADPNEVVKTHTEAKRYEELSKSEQKKWRQRLIDAGVWAAEEGETVLKGIFFSEAAGFVGHLAQGVING